MQTVTVENGKAPSELIDLGKRISRLSAENDN